MMKRVPVLVKADEQFQVARITPKILARVMSNVAGENPNEAFLCGVASEQDCFGSAET